jgi:hypothetical protein
MLVMWDMLRPRDRLKVGGAHCNGSSHDSAHAGMADACQPRPSLGKVVAPACKEIATPSVHTSRASVSHAEVQERDGSSAAAAAAAAAQQCGRVCVC